MFRIGQAVDIHQLVPGRRLILGGVEIPFEKGLKGHSDADVLLHAVAESILGALCLGDLGVHFPDTDPRWKGVSSRVILREVGRMMEEKGWKLENLDATVLAERPHLRRYIDEMRENVAEDLHCGTDRVSIKATRGEKLGFVGREEGITAVCVCLVGRK